MLNIIEEEESMAKFSMRDSAKSVGTPKNEEIVEVAAAQMIVSNNSIYSTEKFAKEERITLPTISDLLKNEENKVKKQKHFF